MNDEDRNYLRSIENARPSFEIFERIAQILTNTQEKTDELLIIADTSLLETSKAS